MRNYTYLILLSLALTLGACVEEFDAGVIADDVHALVVEGQIVGGSECVFYVSHSVTLDAESPSAASMSVGNATVTVRGSDGTRRHAVRGGDLMTYRVEMGALSPDAEYWLEIVYEGRTYESDHLKPLASPGIEAVTYEQPREDRQVDIMVTPVAETDGEVHYYRWSFDEYWEVNTPLIASYEYDPEADAIVDITVDRHRGWCHTTENADVVGSDADYANGQIRLLRLACYGRQDNRFNTLYMMRLRQTAISREEYQYQELSDKLSSEMGGLFTPQPSALPSNVHCTTDDDAPVIGFVGVCLNASDVDLYIPGSEVGYTTPYSVEILSDEAQAEMTMHDIYMAGYRVELYEPMLGTVRWVKRWCVDCTDGLWGASLERPEFWPEDR